MPVSRLTEAELNDLAVQIVRGEVFITNSEEGIRSSFMLLIAGLVDAEGEEALENVGAVYEELSKAGPRSINGYPFFFSMKLLHKDDQEPLHERVEAKRQALESA